VSRGLIRIAGRGVGGLLAAVSLAAPVAAEELWRSGDAHLDFRGSLRELLVGTHGTDGDAFARAVVTNPTQCISTANDFPNCPAFLEVGRSSLVTSLSRLRLQLDLQATPWLAAVVAYDHELIIGGQRDLGQAITDAIRPERIVEAGGEIAGGDHVSWRHVLYRAYLELDLEPLELTAGRQRVPWGVGRLWNPIDRFNAIPPLAVEPDQSQGVDAVKLRWRFSGFSYLEAVYASAQDASDRSYALRLHGVARDTDYSLVFGSFEKAWTIGFDLQRNLGEAAGRVEVVYTDPRRDIRPVGAGRSHELPRYWQAVVSVDHVLSVGSGLYVLVEHLFNGNGLGFGEGEAGVLLPFFEETDDLPDGVPPQLEEPYARVTSNARFGGSRVVTSSRNLTGFEVGYDLLPELRGDLLTIYDWEGHSASFFPRLTYVPLDWLELTLGAQLFVGPRLSQYGDAQALGFLMAEIFF
jgi:hypothetical protein